MKAIVKNGEIIERRFSEADFQQFCHALQKPALELEDRLVFPLAALWLLTALAGHWFIVSFCGYTKPYFLIRYSADTYQAVAGWWPYLHSSATLLLGGFIAWRMARFLKLETCRCGSRGDHQGMCLWCWCLLRGSKQADQEAAARQGKIHPCKVEFVEISEAGD